MNVVCVGDCGIDRYLPAGDRVVGGITANFARHARDQFPPGDTIRIVSAVGDDEDGRIVGQALRGKGIDCDLARRHGRTPVQTIEVLADGERRFVRYEAGVLAGLRFQGARRDRIAAADLLVAPVYRQILGLFDDLMTIDVRGVVAVDFADFAEQPDYALLDRVRERIDIGFFGLDSEAHVPALRNIARAHDKLFVVTLGAGGSLALSAAGDVRCEAMPVAAVVDTTGAGDAYAAGFLSRYCHGASLAASMAHGAGVAAGIVSRHGAYASPLLTRN